MIRGGGGAGIRGGTGGANVVAVDQWVWGTGITIGVRLRQKLIDCATEDG